MEGEAGEYGEEEGEEGGGRRRGRDEGSGEIEQGEEKELEGER